MSLILLKLAIEAFSAILKCIGETVWHNAQRYILPAIYSIGVSYESSCWWLGLTTLPVIIPIDLGYKDYGNKDSVARALWLFVICIVAGIGPSITNHLSWMVYFPYCVVAGFVGTLTRNINNLIEAPITGIWISFPIWFIHP